MNWLGINLPNLITLLRLLSVPVTIWLILDNSFALAFWVFVCAGASDALDGYIAKRFDCRTQFGALLDPVADKAMLASVYVALGLAGQLPNWLVFLVILRDVLIVGGFLLIQTIGAPRQFEPLSVSKLNTLLQILLVAFVLAHLGFGVDDGEVTRFLVVATAVSTLWSGVLYLVRCARALAGAEQPS